MQQNHRVKVKRSGGNTPNQYTVAGYTFKTPQAAEEAKDELNAIKYMSNNIDNDDPVQIYQLYNKIIDKELFRTAVGLDYLKELQQYLYINKSIPNDRIQPIPINQDVQAVIDGRRETVKNKSAIRTLQKESAKYKDWFIKSMIFNVILIIATIVMFAIATTSSNSNIINYEKNIQDKYASWDEELQSREAVIKDKEKELNINVSTP